MFSRVVTVTFFAGASAAVYAQAKKTADEAKIRAIVPHPLPDSALDSFVIGSSRCQEIGPKPAGDLSGAVVVVHPYKP